MSCGAEGSLTVCLGLGYKILFRDTDAASVTFQLKVANTGSSQSAAAVEGLLPGRHYSFKVVICPSTFKLLFSRHLHYTGRFTLHVHILKPLYCVASDA